MNPAPEKPPAGRDSGEDTPRRRKVRTHTPRPDELSCEAFEFITAVDDYKRTHMRSFLTDEEVLAVVHSLGYAREGSADSAAAPTAEEVESYVAVREEYRHREGRLFPTWSEVFTLLTQLGYRRTQDNAA